MNRKHEPPSTPTPSSSIGRPPTNIEEHGIIVQHPRTANPIENPYLAIRDRAAKKLDGMRKVKADFLW